MKNLFVSIIILLIGITIGGWFVLSSPYSRASIIDQVNSTLKKAGMNPIFNNESQSPNIELNKTDDSDGDGLPNWREESIGTDPQNPDTDGDGYLDGEEVFSGYDPLVPAPNDKTELTQFLKDKRNLTEEFAKLSFGTIVEENNISNSINKLSKKQKIKDLLYFPLYLVKVRKDNLKIIPDSTQAIERYTRDYQAIVDKNLYDPSVVQNPVKEVELIKEAVENNDPTIIKMLSDGYQKTYYDLLDLKTPESLADTHKKTIEYIFKTRIVLEQMKSLDKDSLRTVLALEYYQYLLKQGQNLQTEINQQIQDIALEFFQNEQNKQ